MNLTDKERLVLNAIIGGLYAEPGFTDVAAEDLAAATGLSLHAVGGLTTSLQAKGIITVEDDSCCGTFFNLRHNHWHLHPNPDWKDECSCGSCHQSD